MDNEENSCVFCVHVVIWEIELRGSERRGIAAFFVVSCGGSGIEIKLRSTLLPEKDQNLFYQNEI